MNKGKEHEVKAFLTSPFNSAEHSDDDIKCVKKLWALAGVAQWIVHWPANLRS